MPSARFSRAAQQDLQEIVAYTQQQWGAQQTYIYIENLELLSIQLAKAPGLEKYREDLFKGLRAFSFAKHVLFYIEESGGIVIVRVLHQSMEFGHHFEDALND